MCVLFRMMNHAVPYLTISLSIDDSDMMADGKVQKIDIDLTSNQFAIHSVTHWNRQSPPEMRCVIIAAAFPSFFILPIVGRLYLVLINILFSVNDKIVWIFRMWMSESSESPFSFHLFTHKEKLFIHKSYIESLNIENIICSFDIPIGFSGNDTERFKSNTSPKQST